MKLPLKIRVPATSANLGAGFDSFGIALSFHNIFEVSELFSPGEYKIDVEGKGKRELSKKSNLFIVSYEAAFREWGMDPFGLSVKLINSIPMRRGLGSSSSAIVGGVMTANELRRQYGKEPLLKPELLSFMTKLEGHPDNVVPCCLGGMVVSSWANGELRFIRMPQMSEHLRAVVVVPDAELSTAKARKALPKQISMEDAIFNLGRAALFVAAWSMGRFDEFPFAMEDRLHQPYRGKLIPGCAEVIKRAREIRGCYGAAISGAGTSVIAFAEFDSAEDVGHAISEILSSAGSSSRVLILSEDPTGAVVD